MAQLTPVQLLLPAQIEDAGAASSDWVDNVVAFGIVSGIAGVFVLLAYPLTGALSDRTTSRFGRRRPWIASAPWCSPARWCFSASRQDIMGIGSAGPSRCSASAS